LRSAILLAVILFLVATVGFGGCGSKSLVKNSGLNILLIVMDTVRADRLSCYGNARVTTPLVDMLAQRGVRFENFYANSGWTLPSHASLFTGMYPVGHRATQETLKLENRAPTLAGILGDAGYKTMGSSTNGVVSINSGLARGFEQFLEVFRPAVRTEVMRGKWGHPNNVAFESFLTETDPSQPFFVFLNYIEPHAPYQPPEPIRSRFAGPDYTEDQVRTAMLTEMPDHYMHNKIADNQWDLLDRMYEAEINYVDRALDNIYDTLFKDGRLGNTVVIVTSDHGENLGDHGHFAHVFSVHNSLLHVPLVVVFPDLSHQGTVRRDTAQLLDLFPTILDWCGVPYDGRMDGRPLFEAGAESENRYAMAEYYYPSQVLSVFDPEELLSKVERFYPFMKRQRAIQNGEFKLIWGSDGSRELYDLNHDAGETTNLLLETPSHPALDPLVQELERMVNIGMGETPLDSVPPVGWLGPGFEQHIQDEELLKKLRSLGYIR